ncbi:MAG TPA: sigma factor-like helix-turn-helix DNA-binding protein [Terracidiphilus sp.]|nr:sigma factor-like helix-turn-helix DNA-binding protein [Terracidiphilus sp.]
MFERHENANASLIPPKRMPEGAAEFTRSVQGLLDGRAKDNAEVERALTGFDEMLDAIAAGLYNMASMLVGEGEESVRLVEHTIANADMTHSGDPFEARRSSRLTLSRAALETIARREPGGLAPPQGAGGPVSCIDDDDLDSVGVSAREFEQMIAGPDRDRVREWLAKLPARLRTVFVLRAVGGFTSDETAALLAGYGGAGTAGWTNSAVRDMFRQGLCSLASQLIHASADGRR